MHLLDRRELVRQWERFWFSEIPPHSYAALRIAFGLLGLAGLAGLRPVSMFWWLDGIVPEPGPEGFRSALMNAGLGHIAGELFYWGLVASFACMVVGYRTRWAVALSFAGSVLQTNWNRLPLSGAHKGLMVVLFCLVWARCNGVWAVDASLLRSARNGDHEAASGPFVIWPLRLIRFQIALLYLNSGLWKIHGAVWRDGTASYYAMSSNIFQRFPFPLYGASESALIVATYLSLAWELSFVFLLFNRYTRKLALLVGVVVHLAFWVTLEVGPFSWVMLASYIAFLDPQAVAGGWERFRNRRAAARPWLRLRREAVTSSDRF